MNDRQKILAHETGARCNSHSVLHRIMPDSKASKSESVSHNTMKIINHIQLISEI
jgi:hypothetical protein